MQRTALVKLNVLYSYAFLESHNSVENIINKKMILNADLPLPSKSLVTNFDSYFRSELQEAYQELVDSEVQHCIPT